MGKLFKRAARIVVDTIELVIDPENPGESLDVLFSVTRSLKPEPNTAELSIWNLDSDHRSQLEELEEVATTISAGYEGQTAQLYSGTLRNAFTVREGPDLITTIQSGDGEKQYQTKRINLSISEATPNVSLLQQIVKELGIDEGNLGTAAAFLLTSTPILPQGGVLSGSASQMLTRITQSLGFEWSIQEGALQLLRVNDPLVASAVLLTPSTGLVGSPSVDSEGILTAQALLIPDIFPGRLLVLESERLSGSYRVEKCNYSGNTAGSDWYVDLEARKLG